MDKKKLIVFIFGAVFFVGVILFKIITGDIDYMFFNAIGVLTIICVILYKSFAGSEERDL